MSRLVIVLNDGSYTAAAGCRIVSLPEGLQDVESYLKVTAIEDGQHLVRNDGNGTLYIFDGTEVVAFNDDEELILCEAILHFVRTHDWSSSIHELIRAKLGV